MKQLTIALLVFLLCNPFSSIGKQFKLFDIFNSSEWFKSIKSPNASPLKLSKRSFTPKLECYLRLGDCEDILDNVINSTHKPANVVFIKEKIRTFPNPFGPKRKSVSTIMSYFVIYIIQLLF